MKPHTLSVVITTLIIVAAIAVAAAPAQTLAPSAVRNARERTDTSSRLQLSSPHASRGSRVYSSTSFSSPLPAHIRTIDEAAQYRAQQLLHTASTATRDASSLPPITARVHHTHFARTTSASPATPVVARIKQFAPGNIEVLGAELRLLLTGTDARVSAVTGTPLALDRVQFASMHAARSSSSSSSSSSPHTHGVASAEDSEMQAHKEAVAAALRRVLALALPHEPASAGGSITADNSVKHEATVDTSVGTDVWFASMESASDVVQTRTVVDAIAPAVRIQSPRGCRSRKVYFSTTTQTGVTSLHAAFLIEMYAVVVTATQAPAELAYRFVVSRETLQILQETDLQRNVAFNYRVYADGGDLRPHDNPMADFTPHPTGNPDGSAPTAVPQTLISVNGFNSFSDPWLPSAATSTTGNNAEAYADMTPLDGFTPSSNDVRPTLTAALTFDYTFDASQSVTASTPSLREAESTHAFYVVNYLHDYFYDSGFTESAGNGQSNNYGRGGLGADSLEVQTQDHSGVNNARMSTPSDGMRPKMEIYPWTDAFLSISGGTIGNVPTGSAAFGATIYDLTAVIVDLLSAPTACAPFTEDVSGRVALIDRGGGCSFQAKAAAAEAAGAVAVIIVNNIDQTVSMAVDSGAAAVTIPVLSVASSKGAAIRAAIVASAGSTTAHFLRRVRAGGVDTTLVAHEWTHYLHERLTSSCANAQCAAIGEGVSDFVALLTMLRSGDSYTGTYAIGAFAAQDFYYGIRRAPYSTRLDRNPFTFAHVAATASLNFPGVNVRPSSKANSEVHNAGEVFAVALFEAYVALHQSLSGTHTFEQVRRLMTNYLVTGLQLAPADATFVEQRDAFLIGVQASNQAHAVVMAAAFAKRGFGSCALAPPRFSETFEGLIESFDADFAMAERIDVGTITLTDDVVACTTDGVIAAGESGTLSIPVSLPSHILQLTSPGTPLTLTLTLDAASSASITVDGGLTRQVSWPTHGSPVTGTFTVRLSTAARGPHTFKGTVTVSGPQLCRPVTGQYAFEFLLNARRVETAAVSRTDAFDTALSASTWSTSGADSGSWVYVPVSSSRPATAYAWIGADLDHPADNSLVSPAFTVSPTAAFVVSFRHKFSFETAGGSNYDGGVVEFSTDNGGSWADVSTLVTSPYNGVILAAYPPSTPTPNPLRGRNGFVATNSNYPATNDVTLNFGTALAGASVRFRFRVGSDTNTGAEGWQITRFSVTGSTNTPLPQATVVESGCSSCACLNGGTCGVGVQCTCVGHWTGFDCGQCSCQNGGTCQANGSCQCPAGYSGSSCEQMGIGNNPTDGRCTRDMHCNWANPVVGGNTQPDTIGNAGSLSGYCVIPVGQTVGTCRCHSGIGGLNCQCRPVETCNAHGLCNNPDGSCSCTSPWSGPNCATMGGGGGGGTCATCVAAGTASCTEGTGCVCKSGWTGATCSNCDSTHWGSTCQNNCSTCNAAGTASCSSGTAGTGCVCATGWTGATCSNCDSTHWGSSCQNSCSTCNAAGTASCSTGTSGTGCVCNANYTGATCSTPVNNPPSGNSCTINDQCMPYGKGRADNGGFFEGGRCLNGTCSCTYAWSPNPPTGAIGGHCQCRVEGSCQLANASLPYAIYDWTTGARLGCGAATDPRCA